MPEIGPVVRASPDNPAQRAAVRQPLKTRQDRSSHGWAPTDRAPRLRRAAVALELQARGSANPVAVRALARKMRARAQLIDLRGYDDDALAAALELIRFAAHDHAVL